MAKLVSIGEDGDLVGGVRSRGYTIRRAGTTVVVKYGSIEVRGGGGGKYYWVGAFPRVLIHRKGSVKKADDFIARQISSKENRYYERLPGRVTIHPSRKAER